MSFSHLNSEQKRAVETTEGRILILAGAGTGKTSVLIHRIAYLIEYRKVPPEAILGLTFTNKAAREMRQRIAQLVSSSLTKRLSLLTFHSFCLTLLREHIHHLGYTSSFSLFSEQDTRRLIQRLARHLLQCEGELPSIEGYLEKIAQIKLHSLWRKKRGKKKILSFLSSFNNFKSLCAPTMHLTLTACSLLPSISWNNFRQS
jgi:DNA helicase-2/ATP-dependent DNA helicase PcrA